jgi:hypothetical protein
MVSALVLVVVTALAAVAVLALHRASPPSPEPASGATVTPSPYSLPGYISITTPADCAAAAAGNITGYYKLDVSDDDNSYAMLPCQVVFAQLLHPQADGCRWTTVESSNQQIVGGLAIPVAAPMGGTYDVYESLSTGQATLSSTLVCAEGSVSSRWSVTVAVAS